MLRGASFLKAILKHHFGRALYFAEIVLKFNLYAGTKVFEIVEQLQLGAELEALLGGLVVEVHIALEVELVAEELGVAHGSTLKTVPGSAQAVVDVHAV